MIPTATGNGDCGEAAGEQEEPGGDQREAGGRAGGDQAAAAGGSVQTGRHRGSGRQEVLGRGKVSSFSVSGETEFVCAAAFPSTVLERINTAAKGLTCQKVAVAAEPGPVEFLRGRYVSPKVLLPSIRKIKSDVLLLIYIFGFPVAPQIAFVFASRVSH